MPPKNTDITADQPGPLVDDDEASIATHFGGGTGDADGHARDAKVVIHRHTRDSYCENFLHIQGDL